MERDTSQRRAIRQVFRESDRPLSTQEVLEAAKKIKPNIGIATVYRTLKLLLGCDWLANVRLPGEPPRYEIADKPHHHHFHCIKCGRAFEVPGSDELIADIVPPGFTMESHDLVLHGRCAACRDPHVH
ncbi:MAG: transcriptional repressor [Phycisphaerae bacterium]|nr:transcriptional repressor [Phycisphaerae bacterium]